MARPGGVVATVVLLTLGGLLCLGMAAVMGFSFWLVGQTSNPSKVEFPAWIMIFSVALFAGLAAWILATAVGVWKSRPWGRISLLIFSGLLVFMQGFGALMILLVPKLEADPGSRQMMMTIWGALIVFYVSQIAVGIWWLIYFNRAKVKELFAGNAPVSDRPARPLSITIIAWHYVVGALTCLVMLWTGWPAAFFGVLWSGGAARAAYLVMGSIIAFPGIALLKLHPKAVDWAIWYLCLMVLNAAVFWMVGDPEQAVREMMEAMPMKGLAQGRPIPPAPMWPSLVIALLSFAVPLWYLVTRKTAYLAAAQATSSPPAAPPAL